ASPPLPRACLPGLPSALPSPVLDDPTPPAPYTLSLHDALPIFPAVVGDHRPRRIQRPGKRGECAGERRLSGHGPTQMGSPALVDRHPGHDTRVPGVTAEGLHPLPGEPLDRGAAELERRGDLPPDQQAETIRPVQEPRILYLLMDP